MPFTSPDADHFFDHVDGLGSADADVELAELGPGCAALFGAASAKLGRKNRTASAGSVVSFTLLIAGHVPVQLGVADEQQSVAGRVDK